MSKTKKQVMNFITKDRMRRFPDECGKSTLAKFLHSYFPEKVVDSLLASFEVRIDTRCCYKVIMQQSWHSKAKTKKFVM